MVKDYIRKEKTLKPSKQEKKAFRNEARKQVKNILCMAKYRLIELSPDTPAEIAFLHSIQV